MTGRRIAGRTEQGAVGKGNTLYPTLYALRCTLPLSSAGRPGFLGNVNEELVIFSPVPVFPFSPFSSPFSWHRIYDPIPSFRFLYMDISQFWVLTNIKIYCTLVNQN
jgi:hypothetical protein